MTREYIILSCSPSLEIVIYTDEESCMYCDVHVYLIKIYVILHIWNGTWCDFYVCVIHIQYSKSYIYINGIPQMYFETDGK